MKSNFLLAASVAIVVCVGLSSFSFAQAPGGAGFGQGTGPGMNAGQPAGGPAGGRPAAPTQLGVNGLGVVDVAYIFKNHARFKQQMEGMKQKVEAAETDLKRDQDDMKKMVEKLKIMTPGSPDYKNLEADILKKQGDFNLKKSLQGKDFMDQEGKIYFNVSLEIDDAVKQLATRNGISLVLKFNGDPIDANDRNDILRGVNKPIVYFDPRMDITPYVLQELNRATAGTGNIGVKPQPIGGAQPR